MKLYLLRHTRISREGICCGQYDAELHSDFKRDFQMVQSQYSEILDSSLINSQIYTSPLMRARKLAEFLSRNGSVKIDPRLQEMNFGRWEGRSWKEIPEDESRKWADDFQNESPPEGESFFQMRTRVLDFLEECKRLNLNKDILAVTHAGVIRILLGSTLEIPHEKIFSISIDTGKFSCISYANGCWNVDFINR
ncbi:MAG: alpha-ribazole phosphatase family protein [Spirochaetia bacterium]|nr:alpha-ribazole phosphatase family protein [Spirochaetia bacterium]